MKKNTADQVIERIINSDDFDLSDKIQNNSDYKKTSSKVYAYFNSLDKKTMLELESDIVYLETLSTDIAYREGFKAGIRFLTDSLKMA